MTPLRGRKRKQAGVIQQGGGLGDFWVADYKGTGGAPMRDQPGAIHRNPGLTEPGLVEPHEIKELSV